MKLPSAEVLGALGVVATLIAGIVPYVLARRAGQLRKAKFSLRLGYVTERGYSGPAIRHTLFWVPEYSAAGFGAVPFIIENRSQVTVSGLRLQIVLDAAYALSAEVFEDFCRMAGGEFLSHPSIKTRRVQYMPGFVGIEYDIGSLNPGTAHSGCEPLRFPDPEKYTSAKYSTGFDEISRRVRELPTVLHFTLARVSCSAENLPTQSAHINICAMALPADFRKPIDFDGRANLKTGVRQKQVQGGPGTREHAISTQVWTYERCFWLGGPPKNALIVAAWPLTRTEGLEVVQFYQPENEGKRGTLKLELPTTIITRPVTVPRRSYYSLPPEVTSFEKLLRYNGGFLI